MSNNTCTIKNWTKDQLDQYVEQWKEKTAAQLAEVYKVSSRTIGNINRKLGLTKDADWKSKQATITYVLRPRKKYRKKSDAAPVGTIQTYMCNKKLESWIVTEKGREKLHTHNWKQAGNEIPLGYVLAFKDKTLQNPEKSKLENLELKTRADVVRQNVKTRKPPKSKVPVFRIDIAKKKKAERVEVEKKAVAERKKKREEGWQKNREAKALELEARKQERERIRLFNQKEKQRKRELAEAEDRHRNRPRRKEKQFKTIPVDLTKLIPVIIDYKTTVFAKRVEDIPGIKAKYSKAG